MTKFEYHTFSWFFKLEGGYIKDEDVDSEYVDDLNKYLNELGEDGWEMCGVVHVDKSGKSSGGDFAVYTMKREISN
jgi:hypothetical protein